MITTASLAAVILGLAVVAARRRSVSIALVACQSALVGVAALAALPGRGGDFAVATAVLLLKAVALTAALLLSVGATRESAPVRARFDPLLRLVLALGGVLAVNLLIPNGLAIDRLGVHAGFSVVAIGIAVVALRRATLVEVIGVLVAENGIALTAVAVPGGLPSVIELGGVFDVALVISVALVFHHRIYALLGTGNSALLGELRD